MALIFLLGWPLEWVPIVLIIVPILIPVLIKLDVNLVIGILVAVNLQTAWLSPPVALSAYFLIGGARMGSEGYLSWHDAVHGHSGNRPGSDLRLPANCPVASNFDLRRINPTWP